MLTDLDARHAAASQMHNAAIQRVRDLWAEAEKRKLIADEAASAGERLLEQAATDDGAKLTAPELLQAAETAKREVALADIAEARVRAAMRVEHEAQIAEITAKRDLLQADYDGSVTRLISIDDFIDTVVAQLEDALAGRALQLEAVGVAYRAGHAFNQTELNPGHHHNPLLAALPPAQQPKVRVPANGISTYSLKVELFAPIGNTGRRDVIYAVAPRTRMEFDRPVSREDAA